MPQTQSPPSPTKTKPPNPAPITRQPFTLYWPQRHTGLSGELLIIRDATFTTPAGLVTYSDLRRPALLPMLSVSS